MKSLQHQRNVLLTVVGIIVLSSILYLGIYSRVVGQSGLIPILTMSESGLTGISEPLAATADEDLTAYDTEMWTATELASGVYLKKSEDTQVILAEHAIATQQDLANYRDKMTNMLESLDTDTNYKAVVTFSCVHSEASARQSLSSVRLIDLKYRSHPVGVGTFPADISPEARRNFTQFEVQLATQMAELNNIQGFRLVDGFVAAQIEGTSSQLTSISQDPVVYLVDVGPLEWKSNYPDALIAAVDDLYYELDQLIGVEPCIEDSNPKIYLPAIGR